MSSRAAELDSPEPILNAAILSVMGRLKIRRACVLRRDGRTFTSVISKAVPPLTLPAFEIAEPSFAANVPGASQLESLGVPWLIPLKHRGELTAVMCLGPSLTNAEEDPEVRTYLELVRTILAIAVHNVETMASLRKTTVDLQRGTLLLKSLLEFARDFSGALDMERINRLLGLRLMGQLMTSAYVIVLPLDDQSITMVGSLGIDQRWKEVAQAILSLPAPAIISALPLNHPTRDVLDRAGVAMVSPMVLGNHVVGAIAVGPKLNVRPYAEEELQFLEAATGIVASAVENVRMQKQRAEMERLKNELEIASKIQNDLLPLVLPSTPGLDVAAYSRSSRDVGGDYYDVIQLDECRTLLAIADVSGKGVPAALLMANVQAALNILARLELPPTKIVSEINRLVVENTDPEVFITLFLAVINTSTGTIEYVNAGHNPPILLHGDEVTLLNVGGVLTGVIPDPPPYMMGVGGVAAGDVLVLYTDGVTETFNEEHTEFGITALVDIVRGGRNDSAADIRTAICERLREFRGSRPSDDDTSIVCVRVL